MTLHHVFANRSNIGDWLSARAMQSLLPPSVDRRDLFCDDVFIEKTLRVLADVGANDMVLIGGGGLFMDYFSPLWEGVRRIVERTPVIIWGVGYCDNKARASRPPSPLIRQIVSASKLCVVRDELTRQLLDVPAVGPPIICPSVLLVNPQTAKRRALLHAVHYESTGESQYAMLCASTRAFAMRSGREYWETNNEIADASERELAANLRRYADADLVVTTRLHGAIISLASGCRVIAMSGDHKVEAFMQAAGLGEWVCEMGDMDRLNELMNRAEEQPDRQDFIERGRAANREIGRQVSSMIAEFAGTGQA